MSSCHLQSRGHSEQVCQALKSRRYCDLLMVGNDGLRTQSSNLWVFSPFIRSIVGSMRTVEENVVMVPDFSCQEIKTGLDIIESEYKEVVTFNSRTEDLLQTLGIHLKTTEDVRLEPTKSQTRLRKSFVKIKRLKITRNQKSLNNVLFVHLSLNKW